MKHSCSFIIKFIFSLCALSILVSCSSFLYYPSNNFYVDPKKLKLEYEEINFQTPQGDSIAGWYFPTPKKPSLGTIVHFHGNAENITSHFLSLVWLVEKGYNYLIFDYPGYGISTGKPSPENTVEAGMAALSWVRAHKDQRPLIVYGQSLGGAVAARTVENVKDQIPIRNLILDSTFTSYRAVARGILSKSWVTWILQPITYLVLSDKYAVKDLQSISPIPVLVIHGDKDQVVDYKNGVKLFESLKEPKEFWTIPDGYHTDVFARHDKIYRDKFIDYLQKKF